MHPADIVAAVKKRGSSLSTISRNAGLSKSAVSVALLMPSRRAEEALIKFLGMHPHTLFPDRYSPTGARFGRRRRNADEIAAHAPARQPRKPAKRLQGKDTNQ